MARFSEIDDIIHELYDAVSGPAGPRDLGRDEALFHESARMTRTGLDEQGAPVAMAMTPREFHENTADFFARNDFWEVEVARQTRRFGNIAQVLSVYEARSRLEGEPDRRGVNSIQLFHDGDRWWIMNMIWDNEREGLTVPPEWHEQQPAEG